MNLILYVKNEKLNDAFDLEAGNRTKKNRQWNNSSVSIRIYFSFPIMILGSSLLERKQINSYFERF